MTILSVLVEFTEEVLCVVGTFGRFVSVWRFLVALRQGLATTSFAAASSKERSFHYVTRRALFIFVDFLPFSEGWFFRLLDSWSTVRILRLRSFNCSSAPLLVILLGLWRSLLTLIVLSAVPPHLWLCAFFLWSFIPEVVDVVLVFTAWSSTWNSSLLSFSAKEFFLFNSSSVSYLSFWTTRFSNYASSRPTFSNLFFKQFFESLGLWDRNRHIIKIKTFIGYLVKSWLIDSIIWWLSLHLLLWLMTLTGRVIWSRLHLITFAVVWNAFVHVVLDLRRLLFCLCGGPHDLRMLLQLLIFIFLLLLLIPVFLLFLLVLLLRDPSNTWRLRFVVWNLFFKLWIIQLLSGLPLLTKLCMDLLIWLVSWINAHI